jgi:hypothetical protein
MEGSKKCNTAILCHPLDLFFWTTPQLAKPSKVLCEAGIITVLTQLMRVSWCRHHEDYGYIQSNTMVGKTGCRWTTVDAWSLWFGKPCSERNYCPFFKLVSVVHSTVLLFVSMLKCAVCFERDCKKVRSGDLEQVMTVGAKYTVLSFNKRGVFHESNFLKCS